MIKKSRLPNDSQCHLLLSQVEDVELLDKRGYLTVSLNVGKDGRLLLRKPEGIREWHRTIKECVEGCRERKGMMKSTKEFWSKRQFTDSSSMEQWLLSRQTRATGEQEYSNIVLVLSITVALGSATDPYIGVFYCIFLLGCLSRTVRTYTSL